MRKKLKGSGGFSLVEMLCVVAILVLLCLLVNVGLGMAMRSYRDVTAESETQLLLNDLSDALADRLRYSIVTVKQTQEADGTIKTDECIFSLMNVALLDDGKVKNVKISDTGAEEYVEMVDNGKVMVGGKNLLSTGAYGSERSGKRRYEVKIVNVTWDNGVPAAGGVPKWDNLREGQTIIFNIELKVEDTWGGVSESTELTVRCLNPVKKEVEP